MCDHHIGGEQNDVISHFLLVLVCTVLDSRKGSIIIHRGPLGWNEEEQTYSLFDPDKCIRGRVGDRILLGGELTTIFFIEVRFSPFLHPSFLH